MNGILNIELLDARGLQDTEVIGKMDPYVLIQYKDQKLKSKVAKNQGSTPVWNDELSLVMQYPAEDEDYNLVMKIMDKETFSSDDFVGEARINLKELAVLGSRNGTAKLEPKYYGVAGEDRDVHGAEIQVAFVFNLKDNKQMVE
ncbi:hypothetical protein ACHQM5_021306 [Ranunculus cassubicifolius]